MSRDTGRFEGGYREAPRIKRRKRAVRIAFAMHQTEMRAWERRMTATIERLEAAGWQDADFWQFGRLRRALEERYTLTPEESMMATRAIRPDVLLDLIRWLRSCGVGDVDLVTEYVYRTYARLPVNLDIFAHMYPPEYESDQEEC